MNFIWDSDKNNKNISKHKISFETAQLVFDDPNAKSNQYRHVDGEERWQTIGLIGGVTIILVAHTYLDQNSVETVRIISARKATRHEREKYEQD